MKYFQHLQNGLNDLQAMLYSLDENTDLKGFIPSFLKRFNQLKDEIPPEYKEIRDFITSMGKEEDYTWVFEMGTWVDWDPTKGRSVEQNKKHGILRTIDYSFQTLIWGLIGKALEYLPKGKEAKAQFYSDLLNGFDKESNYKHLRRGVTGIETLKLGLEDVNALIQKVYADYEYRKSLNESIQPNQLPYLDHKLWKYFCDWVYNHYSLSLFDENVWESLQLIDYFLKELEDIENEISDYRKKEKQGNLTLKDRKELRKSIIARAGGTVKIRDELSKFIEFVRKKLNEYPSPTEWWDDHIVVEKPKIKDVKRVYEPKIRDKKATVTRSLEDMITEKLSEKKMDTLNLSNTLNVPQLKVLSALYGLEQKKIVEAQGSLWALKKRIKK